MTSFNAERFIQEAIESLLSQTYANWELLIADDCSTDGTRAVISKFSDSRIKVHHNEKNLHYLRTRNKLVEFAKGEFIALLDADDKYHPEKLEKQIRAFQQDDHLHLCGTHVEFMDSTGGKLKFNDIKPLSYPDISEKIKTKNVFTGSTIMVRSDSWRETGGYRDFFNTLGYEDYDLTSRMVEKFKCINLPESLYVYRQYPASTSKLDTLYNPFKFHGFSIVQRFIQQRNDHGQDDLQRGDIPAVINFVIEKNRPYIDDSSRIYRELMWSFMSKGLYKQAYKNIFIAISKGPFRYINFRSLMLLLLISIGILKE